MHGSDRHAAAALLRRTERRSVVSSQVVQQHGAVAVSDFGQTSALQRQQERAGSWRRHAPGRAYEVEGHGLLRHEQPQRSHGEDVRGREQHPQRVPDGAVCRQVSAPACARAAVLKSQRRRQPRAGAGRVADLLKPSAIIITITRPSAISGGGSSCSSTNRGGKSRGYTATAAASSTASTAAATCPQQAFANGSQGLRLGSGVLGQQRLYALAHGRAHDGQRQGQRAHRREDQLCRKRRRACRRDARSSGEVGERIGARQLRRFHHGQAAPVRSCEALHSGARRPVKCTAAGAKDGLRSQLEAAQMARCEEQPRAAATRRDRSAAAAAQGFSSY